MGARRTTTAAYGWPLRTPNGMLTREFTTFIDSQLDKSGTLTYLTCGPYGGDKDVFLVVTDSVHEVPAGTAYVTPPASPDQMRWDRELSMAVLIDLQTPVPHAVPTWLVLHDAS